ncbi:trip-4 [Pristionchus pacificus]|uniref:Asc-1 n=1 Tax=Pristionchus pacificus TaxID=54126 RepID=A0A2A6B6Z9_PRIPA|nr:trip-4 [Pristionchus pacificus]|eukprot:PDM61655.1 asc-1 [Pristionchus pacificus]
MQFALLLCNVYAVDLDYLVFQFINCLVRCSIMARGGGRGGASQQRNTHHHQQQHSRAAVAQQVTAKKQLPGRHPCSCQARIHDLIRNCMGCGKIVCTQEGSGPCFFCRTLVCTKEQREVLSRNSRQSKELYKQLTGEEMPEGGLNQLSLASIASGMQGAIDFANTLLKADQNSEARTRVNDLDSDFANIDSNPFLSKEERQAIIARREELRLIRERRRRAMTVDIDVITRETTVQGQNLHETDAGYDPVIRQILDRSEDRRKASELEAEERVNAADGRWRPIGYVPKYGGGTAASTSCEAQRAFIRQSHEAAVCVGRQSEQAVALDVERRGYSFAVAQPVATLIANGLVRYLRIDEDPMIVGPLFVCSTPAPVSEDDIRKEISRLKLDESTRDLEFSAGSVLGRVYCAEVMTRDEYEEERSTTSPRWNDLPFGRPLPSSPSPDTVPPRFALRFTTAEPLLSAVPHIPPSAGKIYQLEPALRQALQQVFAA